MGACFPLPFSLLRADMFRSSRKEGEKGKEKKGVEPTDREEPTDRAFFARIIPGTHDKEGKKRDGGS